jgi:putative heme-binding domain-containing protein
MLLLALLAVVPLAAQHEEDAKEKRKRNPAIGNPQAIEAGKKMFAASCAACHGPRGEGGRGPNLREQVMWHSLDDDGIFKTVKDGVPGADMPPTNLPEARVWELVAFVRSLTAPAIDTPAPGDPKAGEALFWGKARCSGCHSIRARGGKLGPDLSNAGVLRPLEQLREAVLDPDADGAQGYKAVKITRADGRTLEGVARDRTNYAIVVQDSQGHLHRLLTSDLKEIVLSKRSPMPNDYKKRLSREEIDNLLAYLSKQSVRPPEEFAKEDKR